MSIPIIFDCDPGNDDAVALLVSFVSPELNLLGITVVSGNVGLEQTTINTRKICELANRSDIGVYAGATRPLVRDLIVSDGAHGQTGLDGETMPEPSMSLQEKHAVDFIVDTLKSYPQKITMCLTAPLTNFALALRKDPTIADNIEELVIMGGAVAEGNITPAAEFNFFCDPEAADIVLSAGIKTSIIPLDITHQITITPQRIVELRALNNEAAQQIANMMEATMAFDQEMFDLPGRAVHDVCVPLYLIAPDLFTMKPAAVSIELYSRDNAGHSYISFGSRHLPEAPWIQVPTEVEAEKVYQLIIDRLMRYGELQEQKVKNILHS